MYWKLATSRGRNTKGTKMLGPLVLVVFVFLSVKSEIKEDVCVRSN
jgi:hypothetical protein